MFFTSVLAKNECTRDFRAPRKCGLDTKYPLSSVCVCVCHAVEELSTRAWVQSVLPVCFPLKDSSTGVPH